MKKAKFRLSAASSHSFEIDHPQWRQKTSQSLYFMFSRLGEVPRAQSEHRVQTEGSHTQSFTPGKVALLIVDIQTDFLQSVARTWNRAAGGRRPDHRLLRPVQEKDALAQRFPVDLLDGAIKAVDRHGGEAAMAEMVERGAYLTTLATLAAQLGTPAWPSRAAVSAVH